MDDKEFQHLSRQIAATFNIDLVHYKPEQMRRRLAAFIQRNEPNGIAVFCRRLARDPALQSELRDMMTINVSEFFRDSTHWTRLHMKLMPELLAAKSRLKIWSAACSNGQEPYTLAMILDDLGAADRAQITATDLDRGALARARAGGPYSADDVKGIHPAMRDRHLRSEKDGFYVSDDLRRRVRWRELDLLRGPYGSGFDLIVCRNVLIYFSDTAKEEVLSRCRAALAPGGLIFIGSTESVLAPARLGYERAGGNFYRRTAEPARVAA